MDINQLMALKLKQVEEGNPIRPQTQAMFNANEQPVNNATPVELQSPDAMKQSYMAKNKPVVEKEHALDLGTTKQAEVAQPQQQNNWVQDILKAIPGIAKGAVEFGNKPAGMKTFAALNSDPYMKEALLNRGNEMQKTQDASDIKKKETYATLANTALTNGDTESAKKLFAMAGLTDVPEMKAKQEYSKTWTDQSGNPLREDKGGNLYSDDGNKYVGVPKHYAAPKSLQTVMYDIPGIGSVSLQIDPLQPGVVYDMSGQRVNLPANAVKSIAPSYNPVTGSAGQLSYSNNMPTNPTPQAPPVVQLPQKEESVVDSIVPQLKPKKGLEETMIAKGAIVNPKTLQDVQNKITDNLSNPKYIETAGAVESLKEALLMIEQDPQIYRDIIGRSLGTTEAGLFETYVQNGLDVLMRNRTGAAISTKELDFYKKLFSPRWFNDGEIAIEKMKILYKTLDQAKQRLENPYYTPEYETPKRLLTEPQEETKKEMIGDTDVTNWSKEDKEAYKKAYEATQRSKK